MHFDCRSAFSGNRPLDSTPFRVVIADRMILTQALFIGGGEALLLPSILDANASAESDFVFFSELPIPVWQDILLRIQWHLRSFLNGYSYVLKMRHRQCVPARLLAVLTAHKPCVFRSACSPFVSEL